MYDSDGLCNIKLVEEGEEDYIDKIYDEEDMMDDFLENHKKGMDDFANFYDFDNMMKLAKERQGKPYSDDDYDYYPYLVANDWCLEGGPGIESVII